MIVKAVKTEISMQFREDKLDFFLFIKKNILN